MSSECYDQAEWQSKKVFGKLSKIEYAKLYGCVVLPDFTLLKKVKEYFFLRQSFKWINRQTEVGLYTGFFLRRSTRPIWAGKISDVLFCDMCVLT